MADKVKDPVCGMDIDPAAAAGEEHEGRTFYFCSEACHRTFLTDPHRYGHPQEHGEPGPHGHH
jgi:Cu+-exporting ATPase